MCPSGNPNDEALRQGLRAMIETISEQAFSAGWASGVEFRVWKVLQEGSEQLAQATVSASTREGLRVLSRGCNGWLAWSERHCGPSWLPLDEWTAAFQRWEAGESPWTEEGPSFERVELLQSEQPERTIHEK